MVSLMKPASLEELVCRDSDLGLRVSMPSRRFKELCDSDRECLSDNGGGGVSLESFGNSKCR